MRKWSVALLLALIACASPHGAPSHPIARQAGGGRASTGPHSAGPKPLPATVVDDAAALFRAAKVEGVFALYDLDRDQLLVTDEHEAAARVRPMSTFKLPNTLIGLETGVISGESFTAKWDGTVRPVPEWNRDQTLASAIRDSTVWVFQDVARRVGAARMQAYVDRFDYGNRSIDGGIDTFWLTGELRISPLEQLDFLKRLWRGQLPVSADHAALLKKLIRLRKSGDAELFGKSGFGYDGEAAVGWLVGAVQRGARRAVYATLAHSPATADEGVDDEADDDNVKAAREAVTLASLRKYGWWTNE